MFIHVDLATRDVSLHEPSVFTAFHVVTAPRDAVGADAAEALGDLAKSLDDDHVWISADGIRALAVHQVGTEWESQFAGMVRYAESKGWCSEDGMIRAHLERLEPGSIAERDNTP